MSDKKKNRVWITWADHRRTQELAKALGAELIIIEIEGPLVFRHIKSTFKTIGHFFKNKNSLIFVQNPSRILAALAAFFKLFLGYSLVVDRHTNFRLGKGFSWDPRIWFVIACSNFSLRFADITVVTNDYLKKLVERKGGVGFVLPDRIPNLIPVGNNSSAQQKTAVFICTYAEDEPFFETIQAAKFLSSSVNVVVTGNYKKQNVVNPDNVPSNVTLTGFLSEIDYEALLNKADVILDFTTMDWCLVCGGYEAMALEKPFITSDTAALRNFYGSSVVYTKHDPVEIANAINFVLDNQEKFQTAAAELKKSKDAEWKRIFDNLESKLVDL